MHHLDIAKHIEQHRSSISVQAVELMTSDQFFIARFNDTPRDKLVVEVEQNLAAITKAVRYRSPMILNDHIVWRRGMLVEMRCSTGLVRQGFAHMWSAIASHVPPEALPTIHPYLHEALQQLIYPASHMPQLTEAHDQLAEDLAAASYDSHWDWRAAYQAGGRDEVLHDLWWFVDYTIDAIGVSRPDVLATHLRWLREQAIRRGLATIHIQQLTWFLSEIGERRLVPAAAADLRRMLEKAAYALLYEHEACRVLLANQERIIADVASQLVTLGVASQPEYAAFEAGWYLSYLYDGLATGSPTGLLNYSEWMRAWLPTLGISEALIGQHFVALERALHQYLPEYAADQASALLHAAAQAEVQ